MACQSHAGGESFIEMLLYGLTGGIGMGKTTAASFFKEWEIPVVDTDQLAREVTELGMPGLEEIRLAFGPGVFDPGGELNRGALAEIVFQDSGARKALEEILHPRIRALWRAQVAEWREQRQSKGVVVIPLLFETDAQKFFDGVICVACSAASQWQRLKSRGWGSSQIEQRLSAQWPIEKKMRLSDWVIWSEGQLEVHREQLRRVLEDKI
jgi:dephospho-CoA kinase